MSTSQVEDAKWSKANIDIFVNLMVGEVQKGNRTSSTFNKAGWRDIMNEFTKQTGVKYNQLEMRNKMNKLRADFLIFKKLLETTGFGWNSITRTVTTDDDSVWEKYLEANPKARAFQTKGLPQWPELCIIFGGTYASGDYGVSNPSACSQNMTNERDEENESVDEFISDEENEPLGDTQSESALPQATQTTGPSQIRNHRHDRTPNTKRRRGKSGDWVMAIQAIKEMGRSRIERDALLFAVNTQVAPDTTSVTKAMEVLEEMALNDETYEKVLRKIVADDKWREALIACPPHRRGILLRTID